MTSRQNAQINMFEKVRIIFEENNPTLHGFNPLAEQMDAFDIKNTQLIKYLADQGIGFGGKAEAKESDKQILLNKVLPNSLKAHGWAMTTNNAPMQLLFGVSKEDFNTAELKVVAMVDNIIAGFNANAAALLPYNITAAKVAAMVTARNKFLKGIGSPQVQRSASKEAGAKIAEYITAMIVILNICDKLIEGEFESIIPSVVGQYLDVRRIGTIVHQHTTVEVHVYGDDGHTMPINNATISIDALNRKDRTDGEGMAAIVKFRSGTYMLKVKADNYPDTFVTFSVKRGKHVDIDVVLKPTGIKGTAKQNGVPKAGLRVRVVGTAFTTLTDANGHYSFIGLVAGTYVVEVTNEGGDTDSEIVVVLNGAMSVADLEL